MLDTVSREDRHQGRCQHQHQDQQHLQGMHFYKLLYFCFFIEIWNLIFGISFPLPSGPELPISHADPFKATDTNKCCDDFERGERSLVRSQTVYFNFLSFLFCLFSTKLIICLYKQQVTWTTRILPFSNSKKAKLFWIHHSEIT